MTATRNDWRSTGLIWTGNGPALAWSCAERGERSSPLAGRARLAFVAEGERRCIGVWRGGRRIACPAEAVLAPHATGAQCADCARLDRSRSVAADTRADDQQPYRVYLAYFGPGLLKVGITAAARGSARLLEQGAVAFTWLGSGPLMAARRTEELLGTALGVKDRIPYGEKRAVRTALPPVGERFAELAALHARVDALPGWPESLARAPFEPVDHARSFGLDLLAERAAAGPVTEVAALGDGVVVAGELLGAAGPDLHLGMPGDGVLVLDGRLMAGWRLRAVRPELRATAPTRPVTPAHDAAVQGGLF